jgi:hypothetical protein
MIIPTNVNFIKGKKGELEKGRIGKRRNKGNIYGKTPFKTPCY